MSLAVSSYALLMINVSFNALNLIKLVLNIIICGLSVYIADNILQKKQKECFRDMQEKRTRADLTLHLRYSLC